MSSRTFPAPSNTRTNSRPPEAPLVSQCASANSFAWEVSSIHPSPRFAASVTARSVGVRSVSPLKQKSAMKVAVVVEVAMVISPSTPTSVADCRNAAARVFGTPARKRWKPRRRRAVPVDHRIAAAVGRRRVVDADQVGVGPGDVVLAVLRPGRVPRRQRRAGLHAHVARDDGGAGGLVQEGDGDVAAGLAQLEVRRVKDVAVVVGVGAGLIAEAHAEAVLRGVHPRRLGEVAAVVADRGVPGRGRRAPDVEADAVVDDAPQREGAVLHAAAIAQRAHADGEALHAAQLDLARHRRCAR